MPTLRPLRRYRHQYLRTLPPDPESPSELLIEAEGRTPCLARQKAFTLLERLLIEENYPRNGWRLLAQTQMRSSS